MNKQVPNVKFVIRPEKDFITITSDDIFKDKNYRSKEVSTTKYKEDEEIVGNVYRNFKYDFSIKLPEN